MTDNKLQGHGCGKLKKYKTEDCIRSHFNAFWGGVGWFVVFLKYNSCGVDSDSGRSDACHGGGNGNGDISGELIYTYFHEGVGGYFWGYATPEHHRPHYNTYIHICTIT